MEGVNLDIWASPIPRARVCNTVAAAHYDIYGIFLYPDRCSRPRPIFSALHALNSKQAHFLAPRRPLLIGSLAESSHKSLWLFLYATTWRMEFFVEKSNCW
jgi:hypothetical protein